VKHLETTIQDDALFLHRPAEKVREHAATVAGLGADRVRITAGWSALAPEPRARTVPGDGFDLSDSRTYSDRFETLDRAVKAITSEGVKVQIDLAFWAPRWAVQRASANPARERDRPSPELFADFSAAVAKRYSGAFPDPADRRRKLPAVRMWTTWNEPNHPSFLQPQWIRDRGGAWRPGSPHVYRAMHNAAYEQIKKVSRHNDVLVGGTAAIGSTIPGKGGVPPLQFLREMACVDVRLEPLAVPECDGFEAIKADGWAHHPYSRTTTPGTSAPNLDFVPIADTERLATALERLHDAGRFARRLAIYHTEYGYETSEPDPFVPFTLTDQATFMGWSTYLAWRDPDTRMFAQFLLRDVDERESGRTPGTRGYWRDFQTGLYFKDGRPKPAAQAFKLPFYAELQGVGESQAIMLFGGVRPGRGAQTVLVEGQDPVSGAWAPVTSFGPSCDGRDGSFRTDAAGFFQRSTPVGAARRFRMAWRNPVSRAWERSAEIDVTQPVQPR
jgi:hypothetical protein